MASSELTQSLIAFHETYGLPVADEPTLDVDEETIVLRKELIHEEFWEVDEALSRSTDLNEIAKELADLIYVVVGTAISYGINIEQVFEEVHVSNMSKLGEDGKPVRRESDGKVLKGPNYREADIESVISNQGALRASLRPRRRVLY